MPIDTSRRHWLVGSAALAAAAFLPRRVATAAAAKVSPHRACRAGLTLAAIPDDGSELIRVGEWVRSQGAEADVYGNGELVQAFEAKVAALLGYEAGCFFPTGTMSQLIALRLHAERTGSRAIGVHPSSHHVLHENQSLETLHGASAVPLCPWERPLRGDDLRRTPERLGAVSVELPVRWLGGALQTWSELEDLKAAARERRVPLHMDGARLWECQPYYSRPLDEICRGFDTVYVSVYKTVGALGGAVLVGPKAFLDEARMWRRRHGGDVVALYPYVASAAMRLDRALARVPTWVARAQKLAAALRKDGRIVVAPDPLPTNMLRLYLRGAAPVFNERRDRIARDRKIWVTWGFAPSRVPGFAECELQLADACDAISDAEAAGAVLALLS